MSSDLFEQAAALAREHAQKALAQKNRERDLICYRMGRDLVVEALKSELEVVALRPLEEDAAKERHAILAHIREWLAD